jgi:hypothetical protein
MRSPANFGFTKRLFFLGLWVGLLARPGYAANPRPPACQIRSTTFEGWAAEELSNEWLQLTIVKQLGGRLMQVSFAGHAYSSPCMWTTFLELACSWRLSKFRLFQMADLPGLENTPFLAGCCGSREN